jgi:hypothetical protein
MRTIRSQGRSARRGALSAVAIAAAIVIGGALIAFAQAAPMDPPAMTPGPAATIGVTWLPVTPAGANTTTYTLSYDTTDPFTAPQTVVTTATSAVIAGVDGVTYYAIVQADDGSGVLSNPSAVSQAMADGVAPVSALVPLPASPNGTNGWYTSVAATITVAEANSGLQSLTVNTVDVSADVVFGLPPDPSVYAVPLVQGVNDFSFFGTDVAGNVESPAKTATIRLDSTLPTCSVSVSASGPTSHSITATITAGDTVPGSGVDHVDYVFLPRGTSPGIGTVWTSVAGPSATTTAPQGRKTLFARSVDAAGNISAVQSADVFFDSTAPVTAVVTVPASPTAPGGAWFTAPGITLQVTDADPSTITYYSWNTTDTVATVGNTPVVPLLSGVQTLRYLSVDTAGNREATGTRTFLVLNQQSFTITPSAGANGAISPPTPQTLAAGSSLTFTMAPDVGYHVAAVLVDGVWVGSPTSYDFTALAANHTISVTFSALPTYTIAPTAGAHGAISPPTTQTVDSGADATFTITPDVGYHVANVLIDGVTTGTPTSYTFHGVAANHTISATFAFTLIPTRLTISSRYSRVTHGHSVSFSGVIQPNQPNGTHVGFYVKRPGSRVWSRVSVRHTFSGHHWSYIYRLASRGTYSFQVRFLGTARYAASTSRTIRVVAR